MAKLTTLETFAEIARIMGELDRDETTPEQAHSDFSSLAKRAPASLNFAVPNVPTLEERYKQHTMDEGTDYEESYESSTC